MRSLPCYLLALLLAASTLQAVSAQPLRLAATVTPDPVEPGELALFTVVATNDGTTQLTNVQVAVALPGSIADNPGAGFSPPPNATCPGSSNTCEGGETMAWSAGALAPGQTRALTYGAYVLSNAGDGAPIQQSATASADGGFGAEASASSTVRTDRTVSLALMANPGPVSPGDTLRYRLVVANDAQVAHDVRIVMPLPAGLSLLGTTGGGALESGQVVWMLPSLPAGTGTSLDATTAVGEGLSGGYIITASAEASAITSGGSTARAATATPVTAPATVRLTSRASVDAAAPGELVIFTVTGANHSTSTAECTAVVTLPGPIADNPGAGFSPPPNATCPGSSNTCGGGETLRWSIGPIAAGQSRSLSYGAQLLTSADRGTLVQHSAILSCDGDRGGVASAAAVLGSAAPVAAEDGPPASTFRLAVFPNPTPAATTFSLTLAAPEDVRLVVYDVTGRAVATVLEGRLPAGAHRIPWDASRLPPGVYVCRVAAGSHTRSEKLVVLR